MESKLSLQVEIHTARVWDIGTAKEVALLEGHTDKVVWADFSPDGKRIASISYDGSARLWPASADELLALPKNACDRLDWGRC